MSNSPRRTTNVLSMFTFYIYIIPYIKIIQIIFIATQSVMIGATGSCHMTGGKQN